MAVPRTVSFLLTALCLPLLDIGAAVKAEPVSAFVSLLPQKYFVECVGGDHVTVSVMVAPGQSPATYPHCQPHPAAGRFTQAYSVAVYGIPPA